MILNIGFICGIVMVIGVYYKAFDGITLVGFITNYGNTFV